jgi:hypothetical protein
MKGNAMKNFKLPMASFFLGVLSIPAFADNISVGVPPKAAVSDSGAMQQPAPVNIAPTVRVTGALQQAIPVVPPVRVTGETQQPAQVAPSAEVVQQGASRASMTFMDSKLFDMKLGKELESGKDVVVVDISGRIPLSNIPPRIDKWVVRSAEEGKVELLPSEPAPKTRFIFSLIPLVFNAFGSFKSMQEERMIDQAKRYDTKIYYKKDDTGETLIEKIVMTRRKPN